MSWFFNRKSIEEIEKEAAITPETEDAINELNAVYEKFFRHVKTMYSMHRDTAYLVYETQIHVLRGNADLTWASILSWNLKRYVTPNLIIMLRVIITDATEKIDRRDPLWTAVSRNSQLFEEVVDTFVKIGGNPRTLLQVYDVYLRVVGNLSKRGYRPIYHVSKDHPPTIMLLFNEILLNMRILLLGVEL